MPGGLSARSLPVGTTPDEWQDGVVSMVSSVECTHRKAISRMAVGMLTVRSTNTEQGRLRDYLYEKFAQKIQNTKDLKQLLSARIHSLKKTTEHTEWSLEKLQEASEALKEPLATCRARLGMRQQLPRREKVYDGFQEALLAEGKQIEACRQQLGMAAADTKRILQELRSRRQDLEGDLRDKQHSQALDSMCVEKKHRHVQHRVPLDKCYSRGSDTPRQKPLPELSAGSVTGPGTDEERSRQQRTVDALQQAAATEEVARERGAASSELLEASRKMVLQVRQTTQAEMAAKVERTEVLRLELLKQNKATENKMRDVEKYLGLTSEKLQALDRPLSANCQRERIRKCRTPREDVSDQVSEALYQQMNALKGKKLQLQTQTTAMHDALRDLASAQRSLLEDIVEKDQAISIERACAALKKDAHAVQSFGFSKVGQGQRHFADTASSLVRQVDRPYSQPGSRCPTSRLSTAR